MNADSSSKNPPKKRAAGPGPAAWIFHQLRLSWVVVLAVLAVVGYGLYAGWSTPRQWSDGFFAAAAVQTMIAAVSLLAPAGEGLDASYARYVNDASVNDTRNELFMRTLHQKRFGVRTFLGAVVTVLISAACLRF